MIKILIIALSVIVPVVFNSCQGFNSETFNKNSESIEPINLTVENINISAPNGVIEGELITLTLENSSMSFGGGPKILYRESGKDTLGIGHVKEVPESGSAILKANNNGFPDVEPVSVLPYGVGIVFGAEDSGANSVNYKSISVVGDQVYSEFFEHNYIYWPEQHQINAAQEANAIEDLGTPVTWQSKPLWNMFTSNGYSGYQMPGAMDIFTGFIGWYSPTRKWQSGYVITANAKPVSTTFRSSTGLIDNNQAPKTPSLRQTWIKAGPIPGSGEGSKGDFYASALQEGVLAQYNLDGSQFTSSVATVIGWDRFTYPGYVRGYNRPINAHFYFADIYKAVGPNSRARLEVVDNENYEMREKVTIFDIKSWQPKQIELTVREGIFYQQGLSNQYMYLTLGDGSRYYLGQVP